MANFPADQLFGSRISTTATQHQVLTPCGGGKSHVTALHEYCASFDKLRMR
jgi:hypothetical protein